MELRGNRNKIIAACVLGILAVVVVVRGVMNFSTREQPDVPATEAERIALRAKIDSEELSQLSKEDLTSTYLQRRKNVEEAKQINEPVDVFEQRLQRVVDEFTKRGLALPK